MTRAQPWTNRKNYSLSGFSGATTTFYNWKARFGGLDVSEAKRLKALEEENGKLKKLLAEAMLDNAVLKDLVQRKF